MYVYMYIYMSVSRYVYNTFSSIYLYKKKKICCIKYLARQHGGGGESCLSYPGYTNNNKS